MKSLAKRALMFAWERGWMDASTAIYWIRRLGLVEA